MQRRCTTTTTAGRRRPTRRRRTSSRTRSCPTRAAGCRARRAASTFSAPAVVLRGMVERGEVVAHWGAATATTAGRLYGRKADLPGRAAESWAGTQQGEGRSRGRLGLAQKYIPSSLLTRRAHTAACKSAKRSWGLVLAQPAALSAARPASWRRIPRSSPRTRRACHGASPRPRRRRRAAAPRTRTGRWRGQWRRERRRPSTTRRRAAAAAPAVRRRAGARLGATLSAAASSSVAAPSQKVDGSPARGGGRGRARPARTGLPASTPRRLRHLLAEKEERRVPVVRRVGDHARGREEPGRRRRRRRARRAAATGGARGNGACRRRRTPWPPAACRGGWGASRPTARRRRPGLVGQRVGREDGARRAQRFSMSSSDASQPPPRAGASRSGGRSPRPRFAWINAPTPAARFLPVQTQARTLAAPPASTRQVYAGRVVVAVPLEAGAGGCG